MSPRSLQQLQATLALVCSLFMTCAVSLAEGQVWTETFDDGVGRFDITTGHAEKVFIHDPADHNIHATFIRRQADFDRRLADLGGVVTHEHVAAFSMVWTSRQEGSEGFFAWPSLGFFDSVTHQHIAGIKVRHAEVVSQNWALNIPGVGDPGVPDLSWDWEQTYLLEFEIDGPARTVHFSTAVLVDGDFVPEFSGSMTFPDTIEYSFDSLGIGNIVDPSAFGATLVADVDDVSLIGDDCNDNDVLDFLDIANEESNDNNSNGIPDECECVADLDGNGEVRVPDLIILLASWGPCEGCPADLFPDGSVRVTDLVILLSLWGPCE